VRSPAVAEGALIKCEDSLCSAQVKLRSIAVPLLRFLPLGGAMKSTLWSVHCDACSSTLEVRAGQPQLNRRACEAISASRNHDEEDYSVGGLRRMLKYIGSQEIEAAARAGSPVRALPRAEQHRQERQSCKPQHHACPPLRGPNRMGPNPSFEGTATGGRRLRALRRPVAPVSAPQLKR